jgi:hypothetical protein
MNTHSRHNKIGSIISSLPVALYVVSAGILAIIAAFLLYEGILSTLHAIQTDTLSSSSAEIYSALFHAGTAIALLETIEVFFRTHRIVVEVLFLAGLAEVIRHILVYDIAGIAHGDITTSLYLIGGLIAGILIYQHLTHKTTQKHTEKVRKSTKRQVRKSFFASG